MGFEPATLRDLEEHSNCTELIITSEKFKHWQRLKWFLAYLGDMKKPPIKTMIDKNIAISWVWKAL